MIATPYPSNAFLGQAIGRGDVNADRVAEEAVKRIKNVEDGVDFLRIIEFFFSYLNKAFYARNGLRKILEEVGKDSSRFVKKDIDGLQTTEMLLDHIVKNMRLVFRDSVDVPRDDLFVTAANWITFGLVKTTFPTSLDHLHFHLLNTMPKAHNIRLVVERWKGPGKSGDGQVFESVTFGSENADRTFVISEGARTSLREDAELAEANAESVEASMKKAKLLSGAQAVPLLVRFFGLFVTRKVAKNMARRLVLSVLALGTWKGALGVLSVAAAYTVTYQVLLGDVGETLMGGLKDLAQGVAQVLGGIRESADILVIIGASALGITVLGTALNLVFNR